MPTTTDILETSYPVVNSLPQPASTIIAGTNCDGCWALSGTLEFAVEDDRLAANPINYTDPSGLSVLTSAIFMIPPDQYSIPFQLWAWNEGVNDEIANGNAMSVFFMTSYRSGAGALAGGYHLNETSSLTQEVKGDSESKDAVKRVVESILKAQHVPLSLLASTARNGGSTTYEFPGGPYRLKSGLTYSKNMDLAHALASVDLEVSNMREATFSFAGNKITWDIPVHVTVSDTYDFRKGAAGPVGWGNKLAWANDLAANLATLHLAFSFPVQFDYDDHVTGEFNCNVGQTEPIV